MRSGAWILGLLLTSACGAEPEDPIPEECCPPPDLQLVPAFQVTADGQCIVRWPRTLGCLRVSYDPELEVRARQIRDVLAAWSAPDGMPCFEEPLAAVEPPGSRDHTLHFRPADDFIAQTTVLFEGSTGLIHEASVAVSDDQTAEPLVKTVGHVLGLEHADDGADSAMAAMPQPTDADLRTLGVVYGPEGACR